MKQVLNLKNAFKTYGKTQVLKDINLELNSGEVISLLGDNGAGKSTLIKCLSGLENFDKAKLTINEKKVNLKKYDIKSARDLGFETVYQESSVGLEQEIYRNIFLGREITNTFGFIDIKKEQEVSMHLLQNFLGLRGVGLSANSKVSSLSGGERQGLAIARAIYFDSKVVILDEPTTALAIKDVKKVLSFIKNLQEHEKSCILITHNILHAYEVSDRFIMLDRGEIKVDIKKDDISLEELQNRLLTIQNEY
ncbi:MAG: ABC transporter ATP-binding protein [Arcobacter sp.]|nr:MAG: ABC transporter ATP-binding protein [Arcobacter sp.]